MINILILFCGGYFIKQKGGLSYLHLQFDKVFKKKTEANHVQFAPYYLNKTSMFDILPDSHDDIYFLGNSLTDVVEFQELLDNSHARNRGINGDDTYGILNRLKEVTIGNPCKVFLMCGVNNIQKKIPQTVTCDHLRSIVEKILENSPDTHIFLQSILPANSNKYKYYVLPNHPGIHMPTKRDVALLNNTLIDLSNHYMNVEVIIWKHGRYSGSLPTS